MNSAAFECRLCFGGRLELYYRQGNDGQFRFFKCTDCGLVNLDLSAGIDQTQYIDEWIDPHGRRRSPESRREATFEFIRRHLPTLGRLLDIGCGNGRLLQRAKQAGNLLEEAARGICSTTDCR